MGKKKVLLFTAIAAIVLMTCVFAACAPESYVIFSRGGQEYYKEYAGYFTKIAPEGAAVFSQNGLYGLVNTDGKVVRDAMYAQIDIIKGGYLLRHGAGSYTVTDEDFNVTVDGLIDARSYADCVVGRKDGKYGVWTAEGSVLPAQYDKIVWTPGCLIVNMGEKWGMTDKSGKQTVPMQYVSGSFAGANLASSGDLVKFGREDGGWDIYECYGSLLSTDYYAMEYYAFAGFGMYIHAYSVDGQSVKMRVLDEEFNEIAVLPDDVLGIYGCLDGERLCVMTSSGEYIYNFTSGKLTATDVFNADGAYAYREGEVYNFYGNGQVVLSVPAYESDNLQYVPGSLRGYIFNTATNTLTDLLTGEDVTLGREVVSVTEAEEGVFAVMNAEGKYAACAKNGDMLSEFCYDSLQVAADGFTGVRTAGGYEWCGMDGNVILRSADIRVVK